MEWMGGRTGWKGKGGEWRELASKARVGGRKGWPGIGVVTGTGCGWGYSHGEWMGTISRPLAAL